MKQFKEDILKRISFLVLATIALSFLAELAMEHSHHGKTLSSVEKTEETGAVLEAENLETTSDCAGGDCTSGECHFGHCPAHFINKNHSSGVADTSEEANQVLNMLPPKSPYLEGLARPPRLA